MAANALRSLLTMLGIIIGVAAVITMLAIGDGSRRSRGNERSIRLGSPTSSWCQPRLRCRTGMSYALRGAHRQRLT